MSTHLRLACLALTLAVAIVLAPATAQTSKLPAALSDREFWDLTELVSEPNGTFFSDNFHSNERGYQVIIPELVTTAKSEGIYLGVGPEQNFPYIIALKPALAIVFDIRRGNLHEHLLYKALFELSTDRADFLSRLFSRKRPDGLNATSSVQTLMAAYAAVPPSAELYESNFKAVIDRLTKKHGFALHADDPTGIAFVYRKAFFDGGPALTINGGGAGAICCTSMGTYAEIQSLDDGRGVNRGFLGSETNWQTMKDYQVRNLVVPVVGDFAGPKAIRAVGKYLKERDAIVSAFYLSNVEDWLARAGTQRPFLCNVAALPLDAASTFIFTAANRGGLNTTFLRPMVPDAREC